MSTIGQIRPISLIAHANSKRIIPATGVEDQVGLAGAQGRGHGRETHGALRQGGRALREGIVARSEERRVGEECRSRVSAYH